jgi:WD40 repeat protein
MKPPTISAAAYRHAVANHKSQLVATRAKETDQVLASGAILLPSAAAPSRQAKAASPSLGSPSSNASYRTAAGNADLSKASSSPLHANGKFMSLKGKRKLEIIELEDDEPPKRMRTTRASALGGYSMNSKTPLELDMSDDDDDSSRPQFNFPDDLSQIAPIPNRYGQPFTAEEDALIIYLKEVKGVPWREFEQFFPPRKWPSMQTRYSKVLSRRPAQDGPLRRPALQKEPQHSTRELRRTTTHIPEDSVESSMADQEEVLKAADDEHRCRQVAPPLTYLVRHREVGATSGREWPRKFQAGIRDVANSTMGAQAYMDNASGDVSTISWSPNGKFFAAGAVAVTDAQSIEYNKPRNLVIGSSTKIRELPDHRIEHVLPNGRRKDLFATVQNVAFSPDSNYMYSAGIDHQMHRFEINGSLRETTLIHTVEHPGSVDFLSISNEGMVATGCNYSGPGSILVLAYNDDGDSRPKSARLSGTNVTKEARKYPSALKWGVSSQHKDYLLAGFSKEAEVLYAEDDHRDKEGEVALWDINSQQQIQTDAPNRNVFDLAWNPNPGRDSSIFAVASRVLGHVGHGIHSAIRLYSPGENRARHTMELDCPAWDINDVVYSPHDSNLIAVGSTQGLVHIWDVRMTKHGQSPLSTLTHGTSLAILPHEKKRWEADTGIRFLSWGSERDRLYSGSSDGVVACWNPYRSDSDKHVRDVVQLDSAIMSGAFSPDYCSLLVGEDIGRLNLLTIGNRGEKFNRQTAKFDVQEAPLVEEAAPILWDCQKMFMDNALEVKPLGLMPVHQVVQGPNYQGPYLSDEYEDKSREAAQKFQDKVLRQLNRRNKQRRKSGYKEAEACRLDCKFNPLDDDQKGENKRSQDRIPDQLWTWTEPGGARRNTCLECGGGARIVEGESTLCEKCRFSCFRCEGTVTISPRARAVECTCCGASWNLGALGYELIDSGMARMKERKHEDGKEQRSESEGLTDLCDSEDERAYFHRAPSTDSDGSELL